MNYTTEEIERELRHYPTTPGVNKAADIMRQLLAALANATRDIETYRNAQKACEDCMTPTYADLRQQLTAALSLVAEMKAEKAEAKISWDGIRHLIQFPPLPADQPKQEGERK